MTKTNIIFLSIVALFSACSLSNPSTEQNSTTLIDSLKSQLDIAYCNENWDIVAVFCEQIWQIDSLYFGIENEYAQSLMARGYMDSAIIYLQNQIQRSTMRYDLEELLGLAYLMNNQISQSIDAMEHCITMANPTWEFVEDVANLYYQHGYQSAAIHFYEVALMMLYKSNATIEAKLDYATQLETLDEDNEIAHYIREQILPTGSDTYLPGFDDDIDDNHDMELYFSDPYF